MCKMGRVIIAINIKAVICGIRRFNVDLLRIGTKINNDFKLMFA